MSLRRGRLAAALLLALLACLLLPAPAPAAPRPAPPTTARSAIVMEASTGAVVHAKAARRPRSIASTTKLMTALLTVEALPLQRSLRAASYRPAPVESKIDLAAGERMRVADLLRALMLESANDAAVTLAEGVAGSRKAFVSRMNARARALGLRETRYVDPIGIGAGNRSSARDLARLAVRVRRDPFLRRVMDAPSATLRSGARTRTIANRNRLVTRPGIDGVKTGRTQSAGFVLVGSATRRGVNVVSVVLGTRSEAARDADTLALLRWGAGRFWRPTAVRRGQAIASRPIRHRRGAEARLVAARGIRRVLPRGERARLVPVGVPDDLAGPLPRGARAGSIEVRRGSRVLARVPLVTEWAIPAAGPREQAKELSTRPLVLVAILVAATGTVMLARRSRRGPARRPRARGRKAEAT